MKRSIRTLKRLLDRGEIEKAKRILQSLDDTDDIDVKFLDGVIRSRSGKHAQAAEIFSAVLNEEKDYAFAAAYRGMSLSNLGLYSMAINDFDRALNADPDDTASLFNRAEAYAKMGDAKSAVNDLKAFLECEPEDADARELYSKLVAGEDAKKDDDEDAHVGDCSLGSIMQTPSPPSSSKRKRKSSGRRSAGRQSSASRGKNQPRSALKKKSSSRSEKRQRSAKKRVVFDRVLIREHVRELGGSGGVPTIGGIALGLGDDHEDRSPVHIDAYEKIRSPFRSLKDEYQSSPARERRKLLQESMGVEKYRTRHKEEVRELSRLRKFRVEAEEHDRRLHPDYGTLDIEAMVHPTARRSVEAMYALRDRLGLE